jgi:hypothetical protein
MAPSQTNLVPPGDERIFPAWPTLLPPLPQWFSGAKYRSSLSRRLLCPLYFTTCTHPCSWAGADVELSRVDSILGRICGSTRTWKSRTLSLSLPFLLSHRGVELKSYSTRVIIKILYSLLADGTMDPRLRPTIPPNQPNTGPT